MRSEAGEGDAGSELEFRRVYAQYSQFVWRSLSRLGVAPELVPDAVQDVFLVVHRRLADFEHRSALKTWLFGIALRVARDRMRQATKRAWEPLPATLADPRQDAPFESAARSESVSLLYRLLDTLTPSQRAVFVLVELEQMSVPEAAKAVNANRHTVTSRLKAARRAFEAALRRHRANDPSRGP